MVQEGDLVAIFNSIHRVMKVEKILKELSLPILLIPAPRALSSDCGLAIRYPSTQREEVEKAMHDAGITPEEIHLCQGETFVKLA